MLSYIKPTPLCVCVCVLFPPHIQMNLVVFFTYTYIHTYSIVVVARLSTIIQKLCIHAICSSMCFVEDNTRIVIVCICVYTYIHTHTRDNTLIGTRIKFLKNRFHLILNCHQGYTHFIYI